MRLTISEAARRAGVDRGTMHRKLKAGEISKSEGNDGKPYIDLAELCRVFPRASTDPMPVARAGEGATPASVAEPHPMQQLATEAMHREISTLKDALNDARQERDRAMSLVEAQTRTIGEFQRQLADQRPKEPPMPPNRRGWRLFRA